MASTYHCCHDERISQPACHCELSWRYREGEGARACDSSQVTSDGKKNNVRTLLMMMMKMMIKRKK